MKLAVAGKGGVGKTSITAWLADYLARRGQSVWMVDADTALSLGQASGLSREELPTPLAQRGDLVEERIGRGILNLTPEVDDLPDKLAVTLPGAAGRKRLLVMGGLGEAGGGCACAANALLKSLLAHLLLGPDAWVLVDLEAGVEHLGRGTAASVDALLVVSEPSRRGLETAADIARMADGLGLSRQVLVLNRRPDGVGVPDIPGLPGESETLPFLPGLARRQLDTGSVLGLEEEPLVDAFCARLLARLGRRS
ncbi:P-loop NTPase [Desulfovibrio aminophilus]|nr:P-loop NTPase [Desulfovibrio aminophilus]MCM0755059.1 P-loop NTPase [Desulfovibrio aminophilus]